jgi:hypothetical protein
VSSSQSSNLYRIARESVTVHDDRSPGAVFRRHQTHASCTTALNPSAHLWPEDQDRIRQAVDHAVALMRCEDSLRTRAVPGDRRRRNRRSEHVRDPRFHTLKRISMTSPSSTS